MNFGVPKTPSSEVEMPNDHRIDLSTSENDNQSPRESDNLTSIDPETQAVLSGKEKTDNAPKLPFHILFGKFLWFGCR
jgi:hypothetical protein